jgi:hypothetical protein
MKNMPLVTVLDKQGKFPTSNKDIKRLVPRKESFNMQGVIEQGYTWLSFLSSNTGLLEMVFIKEELFN